MARMEASKLDRLALDSGCVQNTFRSCPCSSYLSGNAESFSSLLLYLLELAFSIMAEDREKAGDREPFSWTENLTRDLLSLYAAYDKKFNNVNYKAVFLWQEIAAKLQATDGERVVWPSAKQCDNRFKSLKSSSKKYLDSLKETGQGKQKRIPPFHTEIMDIIGHKANVEPPAIASSGSPLLSVERANVPSHSTGVASASCPHSDARDSTSATSSACATSVCAQSSTPKGKPVAEGRASHAASRRKPRKRESQASALQKFLGRHEESEKKRQKEEAKRHEEKMKLMGGFLDMMSRMAGEGKKKRKRRTQTPTSSSSDDTESPDTRSSHSSDGSSYEDQPETIRV